MLPLSDGLPARRFPVVNVLLIVACFAVWLFYELPDLNAAIFHASFYPCTIDNACRGPEPWGVSWITAMFLHGGWDHILGNMLFLAIFGKNVEDALGSLWYLVFYFAGGFVAMLAQTAMTLLFGTAGDARVPELGASGAIAAVLGAYFVLYPGSRVLTYIFPVFVVRIPAWIFLGLWFLYQLIEANFGLFSASANGGGVAFFAHVGGFVFGLIVARVLTGAGRVVPQTQADSPPQPARSLSAPGPLAQHDAVTIGSPQGHLPAAPWLIHRRLEHLGLLRQSARVVAVSRVDRQVGDVAVIAKLRRRDGIRAAPEHEGDIPGCAKGPVTRIGLGLVAPGRTTPMSHRGGPDHGNATSPWLRRRRFSQPTAVAAHRRAGPTAGTPLSGGFLRPPRSA